MGLTRTFQINQLFPDLTPVETLGLAISERNGSRRRFLARGGRAAGDRRGNRRVARRASASKPTWTCRRGSSPYGKQRLLEIALALATRPRVLLLDEPAAGVPEEERQDILAALADLPSDVAILLIEHDMDLVFNFADRISVLVAGKLLTEGDAGGDRGGRARPRGLSRRGRRMAELLRVEDFSAGYGEARVVHGASFALRDGQSLALLGRNGVGKTTLIDSLIGVTTRSGGKIVLGGEDIAPLPPYLRARRGIGWMPQERNIFRSLTVEENLTAVAIAGAWTVKRVYGLFPAPRGAARDHGPAIVGRGAANACHRPSAGS